MILEDNPEDYSKPLILQFTNNEIFDLRDPIYDIIQIQDIMKTMDNRIAIDENTLKHFTSDKYIKDVANITAEEKDKVLNYILVVANGKEQLN